MIRPFPIRLELIAMCAILTCDGADAKDGRTYYDAELMARVRQKIEKHDWAKRQIESAKAASAWLIKMSDQELWDFIPPPEQIRAINVHIAHDCPVCGDEITRKAGHYPWIIKRNKPFKLQCPVCKNIFPSNDFQPWNVGGRANRNRAPDILIKDWAGSDPTADATTSFLTTSSGSDGGETFLGGFQDLRKHTCSQISRFTRTSAR